MRVPLSGLTPYTRVYWRVVATNAAGTKRSTTLTLRTRRGATAVSATVSHGLASWGENVTVSGHVDGAGIQGMTVALEQRTFPYLSPFAAVATARVNSTGDFRFRARQALIGTQWRVVTRSTPALTSAEMSTRVRPRLATRVTRATRRAVRLKGTVNPGVLDAVATLQRRTGTGRWTLDQAQDGHDDRRAALHRRVQGEAQAPRPHVPDQGQARVGGLHAGEGHPDPRQPPPARLRAPAARAAEGARCDRAAAGIRPRGSASRQSSGVSQIAASGGSVSSAEWYWFIQGTSSVSTAPRLPTPEPP